MINKNFIRDEDVEQIEKELLNFDGYHLAGAEMIGKTFKPADDIEQIEKELLTFVVPNENIYRYEEFEMIEHRMDRSRRLMGSMEPIDTELSNLEVTDIVNALKEQWPVYYIVACNKAKDGDACRCHICLIDRLSSLAWKK